MINYEKIKNTPISGDRISEVLGDKINVISYNELTKMNSLDEVLNPYRACVILFQTRDNFGHWVLCFERPNGNIEFFDSLSYFPEDELNFISKSYKLKHGLGYPYLIKMLYESGRQIEYNDHKLQGDHSSTCGRWVIARYIMKDYDIDIFAKIFMNSALSPDDELVRITYKI
jgi:hypothetical protein